MISKLCNLIASIPKDKILHCFVAYLIVDICLALFCYFDATMWLSVTLSVVIVSALIFGKETIDEVIYNGWSWLDILAGYIGVTIKVFLFLL